ncbi:hypothetical protein [Hydrogenophaga sp.]|uniref:hypothetical protein n=1 Tax=Hydrogenophaga sp. TaxID=1904254 RepID=UPI0027175005|nr:hypothetical protein [Hydrogenophaga sp.]MDO9434376.1 hypothetical protein [Hydrogenophaga sp.]
MGYRAEERRKWPRTIAGGPTGRRARPTRGGGIQGGGARPAQARRNVAGAHNAGCCRSRGQLGSTQEPSLQWRYSVAIQPSRSPMKNVQSTGTSAPTPLAQGGQQPPGIKPSHDEVVTRWIVKSPEMRTEAFDALLDLAHERLPQHDDLQEAFCMLLRAQQFDTCLEIFEAHRTLRQAAAGAPVKTALRLMLAPDWNPDLVKLEALFKQLRVDSLTVDAGAFTFPAAGCQCIATLLKGGLSELSVGGRLAQPEVVADALINSPLQSMVFLGSSLPLSADPAPIDETTWATVSSLVTGLRRSTVVSLAIHDERLLDMRAGWRSLLSDRPDLQTLAVRLKMPDFNRYAWETVCNFMLLVRESNAFTAITLTAGPDVFIVDASDVHVAIFVPLKGHPRLLSLELRTMPQLPCAQENMKSLLCSTAFAASCPSLENFVWEAEASDLSVESLRTFKEAAGELHATGDYVRFRANAEKMLPRMKKMVLIGHPLANGPLDVLAQVQAGMNSGMALDLRKSLINVESAFALDAAWKKDPTRGKLMLPASFDRYYLMREGDIWGISENAAHTGFVLSHSGFLNQAACNRAIAAFDAMKPTLLGVMRDIRQQLVQSTSPLLESNVQAFMQAALRSALPNIQGVGDDAFSLAAQTIVELLVKQERVPTALHLGALNGGIFKGYQSNLDRLNVATNEGLDLRSNTKRLVDMERDQHAALMDAVEMCDMETVDQLLSEGAVDIGGRARQSAKQQVKEGWILPTSMGVFEKYVPKLATDSNHASNTPVTTINTTTTTTTTGTTTTRGTTTAAAQVVAVDDALARSEATWAAWKSKIPQGATDRVVANLKSLAQGVVPNPAEMRQVFVCLLEKGAFDVFVDAFNTYCGMRRAVAEMSKAPPFRSSLAIELPRSWAPDLGKLNAALQRIQVDTLRLKAPPAQAANYPNVSRAACHLVAGLLKGGTTVLHIGGVLADPELVARAMRQSKLRSLTLLGVPDWTMKGRLEMETYETLAIGVTGCATLNELSIRDEQLFALHIELARYLKAAPELNALEVSLGGSMERSQITSFMKLANRLPSLSRVEVHFDVEGTRQTPSTAVGVNRVQGAIFSPLFGNTSLTTLDMGWMPMSVDSPIIMTAVPKAFVFAASCPSLKHVSWTVIPSAKLTVQRLQAFANAGADMDMITASTQIAKAYSKPDASLTTVSLTGFVLPPGPMLAWSAALAGNRSLRELDLRRCLLDAQSAATLFSSLQKNPLFETLKVSTNYSDYYFRFEGRIWSIAQKSDGSGLELLREGQPDGALDQRAAVAFTAVENGLHHLIEMSLGHAIRSVVEAEHS